jgi:restriction system protein
MTRYWVIAPYAFDVDNQKIFESVWEFNLRYGVISMGWRKLGDIMNLSKDELRSKMEQVYSHYSPATTTRCVNMLWGFINEVQPGDIIISRRGRKHIASIGTVTKSAYFSESKNRDVLRDFNDDFHSYFIDVKWHETQRDMAFDRMVFGMQAFYETQEAQYQMLIGDTDEVIDPDVEDRTAFVLEKHLEEFIIENFDAIFGGELELYVDSDEDATGQQYATDVGIIDILAYDPSEKMFVVIELKRGRGVDSVVGQTLRYIGWVQENLCEEGQGVRGLIICHEVDEKLKYALVSVNNIRVKLYEVDFRLHDSKENAG